MKKIFLSILVIVLLGGVLLGGYFVYNRYLKTEDVAKTPLANGVYYNNELLTEDSKISLNCLKENEFKVVFDAVGYSLKISPKSEFSYTVDGEEHCFLDFTDLTEYFNIDYLSDSFKINVTNEFSMQNFLETIYPEAQQIIISDYVSHDYNFSLSVYSSDYEESITVSFNLINSLDNGLSLDKTEILF